MAEYDSIETEAIPLEIEWYLTVLKNNRYEKVSDSVKTGVELIPLYNEYKEKNPEEDVLFCAHIPKLERVQYEINCDLNDFLPDGYLGVPFK